MEWWFCLIWGSSLPKENAGNHFDATILVLTGGISGTGGVTKAGTGTLELTEQGSFSGQTVVAAGTLALTGTGGIADARKPPSLCNPSDAWFLKPKGLV